ncbi:hypothetical protein IIB34_06050, partial [PVC group bacterium]|nr:hypothetical protein [PVC group bacterium]
MRKNSFNTLKNIKIGSKNYQYFDLMELAEKYESIKTLPYSLKILLENVLRHEDGKNVTKNDIEAILSWKPEEKPSREISFMPARVLMQDFTGVPAVVDLAALRDSIAEAGGQASKINPVLPTELVIDHSVQVDSYGSDASFLINVEKEFERKQLDKAANDWISNMDVKRGGRRGNIKFPMPVSLISLLNYSTDYTNEKGENAVMVTLDHM